MKLITRRACQFRLLPKQPCNGKRSRSRAAVRAWQQLKVLGTYVGQFFKSLHTLTSLSFKLLYPFSKYEQSKYLYGEESCQTELF